MVLTLGRVNRRKCRKLCRAFELGGTRTMTKDEAFQRSQETPTGTWVLGEVETNSILLTLSRRTSSVGMVSC